MSRIASVLRLVGVSLRAAPLTMASLALVIAVGSFLATAAPGWFDQQSEGALAGLLAGAPAGAGSLAFEETGTLGVINDESTQPLDVVDAEGRKLLAQVPASIAGGLGTPVTLIDGQEYEGIGAPQSTTFITPRFEPAAEGGIRIVAGRAPTGHVEFEPNDIGFGEVGVFEVALSRQTADALLLDVGGRLNLSHVAARGFNQTNLFMRAVVVGIFEVTDPSDPRWFGDRTLEIPSVRRISAEHFDYHAIALLSPEAYTPFVFGNSGVLRYRWRFALDPHRPAAVGLDAFALDLAAVTRQFPFRAGASVPGVAGLSTGLPSLLDRFRAQRAVASTAVSLASIGAIGATAGTLVMIAGVLRRRRATAVRLARARGADLGRLLAIGFLEAVAVVAPAAGAGWLAATAWLRLESGARPIDAGAAGLVALVAVVLLLVTTLRAARVPLALGRERADRTLDARNRRRVLDGLVIVLAVVLALGLRSGAPTNSTAAPDATRALAPLVLALAGAIVLLRVFNGLVAVLARLTRRGRGFVVLHAARSLARGSRTHEVPLVVLLVAIASGVFASGVSTTIARTQVLDAETAVGADYRLESTDPGVLPTSLDLAALSAIGPTAVSARDAGVITGAGPARLSVEIVALDIAAYRAVVAGMPIDPALPPEMLTTQPTTGQAIPIVVQPALAADSGIRVGMTVQLVIGKTTVPAVVAAVADPIPAVRLGRGILVSLPALRTTFPDRSLLPTQVFLRAGPGDRSRLDTILEPYGRGVTVATLTGGLAALQAPPLVGTMTEAFIAAGLVAALFAMVVVGASVAQALALRASELSLLRAIGLSDRRAVGVVALELGSTMLVAIAGGVCLGLAATELVVPGLGLAQLVGADVTAPPAVEPSGLALAVAGPAVAALVALLVLSRSVGGPAAVTEWIRTAET